MHRSTPTHPPIPHTPPYTPPHPAKNVQDCLLIHEKSNPLCMLPPPLNAASAAVWLVDYYYSHYHSSSSSSYHTQHTHSHAHPTHAHTQHAHPTHAHPTQRTSICGWASDLLIGLLTAPLCAAGELYLVNAEVWASQVPRPTALAFTAITLLFCPVWYTLFLALIVHHILRAPPPRISNRDNRIIYTTPTTPKVDTGRPTGGLITVKLIRLHTPHGVGLFGRRANTYVRATYGNQTADSPPIVYSPPSSLFDYAFAFELDGWSSVRFEVFDQGDTGQAGTARGVLTTPVRRNSSPFSSPSPSSTPSSPPLPLTLARTAPHPPSPPSSLPVPHPQPLLPSSPSSIPSPHTPHPTPYTPHILTSIPTPHTSPHHPPTHPPTHPGASDGDDVLMAAETVDLKAWIANGRFQGPLSLSHPSLGPVGDFIQLDVKITYPKSIIRKPIVSG
jgi:hypothetical protein